MAGKKKQHCYDYPRPALTVDVALFTVKKDRLHILLIQRKHEPFAGKWALPGGFVDEGEKIVEAARRELAEETGVKIRHLQEFGAFGDPRRDPRGWTVSVAFAAIIDFEKAEAKAADDAASAGWFPIRKLPPLAFDHDRIIAAAWEATRQEAKSKKRHRRRKSSARRAAP